MQGKKRYFIFSLVLMVSLMLTGCFGFLTECGDLKITVLDSKTNQPIENALVNVVQSGESGFTNSKGEITLADLSVGSGIKIEVAHDDYVKKTESVSIVKNKVTDKTIKLVPKNVDSGDPEEKVDPNESARTTVQNIRDVGINLEGIWQPQMIRIEEHISEEIVPFIDELLPLLAVLLDEEDIEVIEEHIDDLHERIVYKSGDYTVKLEVDLSELDELFEKEVNSIWMKFEIKDDVMDKIVGEGRYEVKANLDEAILDQWDKWVNDPEIHPVPDQMFFETGSAVISGSFDAGDLGEVKVNAEAKIDTDTMEFTINGDLNSPVIYFEGNVSGTMGQSASHSLKTKNYPLDVELDGKIGFEKVAEIFGEVEIDLSYDDNTEELNINNASLHGMYTDTSGTELAILEGNFWFQWLDVINIADVAVTAEFKGIVRETSRPIVDLELSLDLRNDGFEVDVDYTYNNIHKLKGSIVASYEYVSEYLEMDSVIIDLVNEDSVRFLLEIKGEPGEVGVIECPEGEKLAVIELDESLGVKIFYTDTGEYETLF